MADAVQVNVALTRLNLTRRKKSDNTFSFVLRWIIGGGHSFIAPGDRFDVTIRQVRADRCLAPNGLFGDPEVTHTIPVAPQNFVMIEPPRRIEDTGGDNGPVRRRVAVRPTKAVKPREAAGNRLPEGEGLGITHVLAEMQPSRQAWRAARTVHPAFVSRLARAAGLLRAAGVDAGSHADDMAREMGRHLVRGHLPNRNLKQVVRRGVQALQAEMRGEGMGAVDHPFTFHEPRSPLRWQYAAGFAEAVADKATLAELDLVTDQIRSLGQQLLLKGLTGGEMIDYWAGSLDQVDDLQRGARHPAAELVGQGLTIGAFTDAQVRQWEDADEAFRITVTHVPGTHALDEVLDVDDADQAGNLSGFDKPYAPADILLCKADLTRGLRFGSSQPPTVPADAWIDYDLLQRDENGKEPFRNAGFATGDGRVQILIRPGERPSSSASFGYNLYGVWETAQTTGWFAPDADDPCLDALKPWRITRRYAFETDLAPAFPTTDGALHPAVDAALHNPPWEPVIPRPDAMESTPLPPEAAGDPPRPLSELAPPGCDLFALDLRRGMRAGGERFIGWEPRGLPAYDWMPDQTRAGRPAAAGQRYRFWVTAVDQFGQESAAKRVRTADTDAEPKSPETYIFVPQFRTPPQGGILHALDAQEHRGLTFQSAARKLLIRFDTPPVALMGTDSAAVMPPLPSRHVVADVVVLRRVLRRKVETKHAGFAPVTALADQLAPIPGWCAVFEDLHSQGFEEYDALTLDQPDSSGTWNASLVLEPLHLGYDYVAAIAFRVREAATTLYAPPSRKRVVRVPKLGERPDREKMPRMEETPRHGVVVLTSTVAVPNPVAARGVTVKAAAFQRADPVLPAPGLDRDLILMRLLQRPVFDGEKPVNEVLAGTDIAVTAAQAAMIHAALSRAAGVSPDIAAHDPALATARQILGAELQSPIARQSTLRTQTVGFRGLYKLTWCYTPLLSEGQQATADEAEAVRLRAYGVTVPADRHRADRLATFVADVHLVRQDGAKKTATYAIETVVRDPSGGGLITALRVPAFVQVLQAGTDADWTARGVVLDGIPTIDRAEVTIALDQVRDSLPARGRMRMYISQLLWEGEIPASRERVSGDLLLPVGGGLAEVGCWWLTTASAQEVEATADRRFWAVRNLPTTVEPDSPADVRVSQPVDNTEQVLRPVEVPEPMRRDRLPADVCTARDAERLPRLVISWRPYDDEEQSPESRVHVLVERERRRIEGASTLAGLSDDSAWKVLKAVQDLSDGEVLQLPWLATIRASRWLLGARVEATGVADPYPYYVWDFRTAPVGTDGFKRIGIGTAIRASLIDYFRDDPRTEPQHVMDGTFEYAYRLTPYVDLEPGKPPPQSPADWPARYLRGQPTPYSGYVRPSTAPIEATIHHRDTSDPEALSPSVTVEFRLSGSTVANFGTGLWKYRILLRRLRTAAMWLRAAPGTSAQDSWVYVAHPLELDSGTPAGTLFDRDLDRTERTQVIDVCYEIVIQQIIRVTDHSGQSFDQILRAPEERSNRVFKVEIPGLQPSDQYERKVVVTVEL